MKIILIRHGRTAGNLEGRYVGRTDEPLCGAGRAALADKNPPAAERLYVSPLARCRETAEILYPELDPVPVPGFRECDFGDFEMKNYAELNGNAAYQAWIDSNGTLPFPGGESQAGFQARCCAAFEPIADELLKGNPDSAAFVVHGGTIMAILSQFGEPQRPYFDWQVKNGEGFTALLARENSEIVLREIEKISW